MKREGQVRQQYKQVKFRIRKKLLDKSMRVEPSNCCFHAPVSVEKTSGVVLCAYKEMTEAEDWDVVVCDMEQAKRCARFAPEATSDEIKSRFEKFLASAETSGDAQDIGTLAYHYPDLAALIWVLEPWVLQEETPCEGCATGGCCEVDHLDSDDSGSCPVPAASAGSALRVADAHESEPERSVILEEGVSSDTPSPASVSLSEIPPLSSVAPDKIEEDADIEHPVVTSAEALRRQEHFPSRVWLPVTGVAVAAALLFLILYWSFSG